MSSYISAELRRLVRARAFERCEYCLIAAEDTFAGCELDHIISEKHGGATVLENLAYSCAACNRCKGTDVGSIIQATGEFVRFFNPRTDNWHDHFALDGARIESRTTVGQVTARILGFNVGDRIKERAILQLAGVYPQKGSAG